MPQSMSTTSPNSQKSKFLGLEFISLDYAPQTTKNKIVTQQRLSKQEILKCKPTQRTQTTHNHVFPSPHLPISPSQLPNPLYQTKITDNPKQSPPICHKYKHTATTALSTQLITSTKSMSPFTNKLNTSERR